MLRSPLLRLQQTATQFIKVIPESIIKAPSAAARSQDTMSRPNGTIATQGLELLTYGTPNGHKASIILEELKDAYGKPDYVFQSINIGEDIQKEPWFTKYVRCVHRTRRID